MQKTQSKCVPRVVHSWDLWYKDNPEYAEAEPENCAAGNEEPEQL